MLFLPEKETIVSLPLFSLVFVGLFAILCRILVSPPTALLSSRVKQILSIPLFIATFIMPLQFHFHTPGCDVICAAFGILAWTRLFDLFWIKPLRDGSPVYMAWGEVQQELWSPLRKQPHRKAKDDHKDDPSREAHIKSSWSLLPSLIVHYLIIDIISRYLMTFTSADVFTMRERGDWSYYAFGFIGVVGVSVEFMVLSIWTTMVYTLIFEGRRFDSDKWQPIMNHPYLATSLHNFWSHRWHQIFRRTWTSVAFQPVHRFVQTRLNPQLTKLGILQTQIDVLALACAILSVFVVSGLMHEYIALAALGKNRYIPGEQLLFFSLHGLAVVIEKILLTSLVPSSLPGKRILGWAYTLVFGMATFPLFFNTFAKLEIWNTLSYQPSLMMGVVRTLCERHADWCGSVQI